MSTRSYQLIRRLLGAGLLTLTSVGVAEANHDYHNCALFEDGSIKCWGYNAHGALGLGDTNNRGDAAGEMGDSLPFVNLGEPAVWMETSHAQTCAITQSGALKCWGYNPHGQAGQGRNDNLGLSAATVPANLAAIDYGSNLTLAEVDMGVHGVCVRFDDGRVKCWGYNATGCLGYGDTNHRGDVANEMGDNLPFVDLGTGRTATRVDFGYIHACAILDNG